MLKHFPFASSACYVAITGLMYRDTKEDPSLGSICLVIHPKCLRSLEGALLRMFVFCMKILIFFLYSYSLGKTFVFKTFVLVNLRKLISLSTKVLGLYSETI